MIDDTVLVVDADQETEENIVSVLEGEGYLVFTVSGRDINSGMAEKITPSLIYLKPTSATPEGFEICKTVHNIERFRDVPIILLASLKGPMDPRYTSFYGIVDYLALPINPGELIKKTKAVYGSGLSGAAGEFGETEKSPEVAREEADAYTMHAPADELSGAVSAREADIGGMEEYHLSEPQDVAEGVPEEAEIGRPSEDYSYEDVHEKLKKTLGTKGMKKRPGYGLSAPVAVAIAAIVIVAGGFLAYRFFFSPAERKAPVAMKPAPQAQQRQTAVPPLPAPPKTQQPAAELKPAVSKEVAQEATATKAEAKPVDTKPATQKASGTNPGARPVGKPGYSVQLGAFKTESAAAALAKTYKGKGYEAFTLKGTTKDGATVYRVLVGRYENKKEALALEGRIRTKEKAGTIVFSGVLE